VDNPRPNKPIQPTPLCGHKIVRILKPGNHPNAFPIYQCSAADGQGVGPQISLSYNSAHNNRNDLTYLVS
jgi:hypothetical protein